MFCLPLFDKYEKSGTFLDSFIIAAAVVITMIHYNMLMATSHIGHCAHMEQKGSTYPNVNKLSDSNLSNFILLQS